MTYSEMKQQAAELLMKAEALRVQELQGAIDAIKAQIAQYGITAEQLGLKPVAKVVLRKKAAVKYRLPSGEEWSGRGRRPKAFQGVDLATVSA